MHRLLFAVVLLLVLNRPAHAQRDAKVPDPDPEIERKSFQMADGFEVNLFAADPLLAKPIQMNFDPSGRLWVATSETYPQIKPGEKANDKVIVLEDRDGDGRADRTTIFADGLLIPTGIEPGDGGAYVADSTDLLHLADTDGDGRADRRHVVLSGFGTEDTHHILHTFRHGPDGMLYFNQSIYIHSHIETPHGVRRLNAGGVWQFRPETMRLDVFLRGFCNPWGHHFDRWGQSFATDGAYGEGINYGLPGAYYVFAQPSPRLLAGLNPGSPKHCGLEIVSGRHLPPDWQGNMVTNDFRGHRVCRFVVSDDAAGYASREMKEVIKSNHPAFRPIDVKMGPDGAIYIADWYNPIIQHGEVDFRDPRRDRTHGRIWRVSAKGRPPVARPKLVGAPITELLEHLKAPEDWTRQQAKRVLKERGAAEVVPALTAWRTGLDANDADHEHHLLEALWTHQALDVPEPKLLARVLASKEPRARAAGVRVLSHWRERVPHVHEALSAAVVDAHPRVRLEAVRALGATSEARAVEVAMRALDQPVDKFLDYALWLTARELESAWLPEVTAGRRNFGGNAGHLIFALQSVGSPAVVRPLVDLVRSGKVPAERTEGVLTTVATLGGPPELALIFESIVAGDAPAARRAGLLAALAQASRQRGVRPAGDLGRLATLLDAEDESLRAAAVRAAGLWQLEALRPRLAEYAKSAGSNEALRRSAIDALAQLGGPASRTVLEELAATGRPFATRQSAVVALAHLDIQAAAPRAVALLSEVPQGANPDELFSAFLERKNGAAVLARALDGRKLPADAAKLGVRAVRGTTRPVPALLDALQKAGGLTAGPRTVAAAEVRALVDEVGKTGDPARGEAVFRRKDQACLKCHAIAGAGGLVGPDLLSIGASAPVDYLVESILLPNKAIKENYHSINVVTRKGQLVSGVKVRETAGELVLRNAEDREVAVPSRDIEERSNGGSLMPEGQADALTRTELVDLVRFLSELGKVGPYAVGPARVVRRWQALEPTGPAWTLLSRTRLASAASDDPALTWSAAYSTVGGVLPLGELPRFDRKKPGTNELQPTAFVRCQLEASATGRVRLALNGATGLTAWLDGNPVEMKDEVTLEVGPGLHTLTVAVDLAARREALRCEVDDAPGSAAKVRIVGGK